MRALQFRRSQARTGPVAAAAAVALAGVLVVALLRQASEPGMADARAEQPSEAGPAPAVPIPSQTSLIPPEARDVIYRAIERCGREPTAANVASLARVYHGNGLTRLAGECYQIALQLGADDPKTPYLLGLILLEDGRAKDAAAHFRIAIQREAEQIGAGYAMAHYNLGRALLDLGEGSDDAGNGSDALVAMNRAVELAPNDPVAHTGRAMALRAAGRLDDAEASLRRAIALDPDHAAAHQLLGLILHAQGDSDGAHEHLAQLRRYNASVYDDPWTWDAYRYAAAIEIRLDWVRSLLASGRVEAAFSILRELRHEHPANAHVLAAIGDAQDAAGNHQQAVNAYLRAAELDPSDSRSRLNVARILLAYQQFAEAQDHANAALHIDPGLVEAECVLGAVALREGRVDDAIAILEEAVPRRPTDFIGTLSLGEALLAASRHEDAVDVLARAAELRRDAAGAYAQHQLAVALRSLGRVDEAEAALLKAMEMDPRNQAIQNELRSVRAGLEREHLE